MEDWVLKGMQRWPDVPALYGWLGLDRRGRWTVRGETISRPQIVDTIARNYGCDAQGRWYFQNGPQRGYVRLKRAPLLLTARDGGLRTHTGRAVERPSAALLDEDGGLWLVTEHGPAALLDDELDWLLERLLYAGVPVDEDGLAQALALPDGALSALELRLDAVTLPLRRLDRASAPVTLGFEPEPRPRAGERASYGGLPAPA